MDLVEKYAAGPRLLREAIAGMTAQQINAAPIPGKWSTHHLICHLCDFEPVYADRMKRVLVLDEPALLALPENSLATRLAYGVRNIEEELDLIENLRKQMTRILRTLTPADFQRKGLHSEDGPLTLQTLLERAANHIPHHAAFIPEKRAAMAS